MGTRARGKLAAYRRKRDFGRTPEPAGDRTDRTGSGLHFVIQKHAASHLHFDLRLELGGVMKSWAVPKGPSLDPAVKRLAMEVEDHPMEYNDFEGTIPAGEYGGGTVMLWDRGTYGPVEADGDPEEALRSGYRRGRIDFVLQGERLSGAWSLVRTHQEEGGERSKWLLVKREDQASRSLGDVVAEETTSVHSGRTMDQIARGVGSRRVWKSNRAHPKIARPAGGRTASLPASAGSLAPMLAFASDALPEGRGWTYELKYDGIRVLALATAESAALLTRNGNDKAAQFPEVAEGLRSLAAALGEPVVLDGEIVGVGPEGGPLRFGSLQGRMHARDRAVIDRSAREQRAAFVAFDLLLRGEEVSVHEPWAERRAALEEMLEGRTSDAVWLAASSTDRATVLREARAGGWEGVMAKRVDSVYRPGERSRSWLKVKLENRQELVVGGWTEPRRSREHFGALLLGYHDARGRLVYAGHTGTGFTRETLEAVYRRLKRLERKTSPFVEEPATNEPAHWVTPRVVVEIKFNQWTRDGKLRQPVFVGLRDDKDARSVVLEGPSAAAAPEPAGDGARAAEPSRRGRTPTPAAPSDPLADHALVGRLRALTAEPGAGGTLRLGRRERLAVSNLGKVFFPRTRQTKGDLLAYYAAMADFILPCMQDRPLVLKRFPNGVGGKSFYQQAAPEDAPPGVRVESVRLAEEKEPKPRLVGGNLTTLLYTVQLGAISYDPWHSRLGHLDAADYTVLDLDPGPGAAFRRVVSVARWVKEEMDAFGLHGGLKTSGSSGLHIYLPLPPGTPLEAATLVAQIIATRVAARHPREATVERMKKSRPRGTVYVDYLQNILGKTVAGVYAVRAKPGATVSTPLAWDELTDDLDLRDFTMESVPRRVAEVGDLWAEAMAKPNSLAALLRGAGGDDR